MDDGSIGTYSQSDIDDGTVERDNQRKKNEELYGCYITDAALERGDCDIPEDVIEEDIIIADELYEEIPEGDTDEKFTPND